jgi:glutathione S-transferase
MPIIGVETMTPILLHYEASPYAELVRAAFGIKGLAWASLIVPSVLPKPDQAELTGGYGRTPVLQLGADIYCDTAAMLMAIEALPGPSLYPQPLAALHRMVAGWAGGAQFMAHVGAAMGNMPAEAMGAAFIADRQARFGLDMAALGKAAPHLTGQAMVASAWLADVLGDGRAFIGGDAPGHGDLALYANLWFVKAVPFAGQASARMLGQPGVADWYARMAAFGHGARSEISGEAAIAIAAAAEPVPVTGGVDAPYVAGMAALVKSEGSNDPPVAGTLVRCDDGGITLLRTGARCGAVAVHFPRLGQVVLPG